MIRATDPLTSIYKATLEAAERYASLALQGTESVFKCQMAVARELFTLSGKQLTRWSSETPSPVAGVDWPTLFRANAERAAELTRACAETAAKAQGELARLSQEQMGLVSKLWQENIQGITTAAEAAGIAGVEPFEHKQRKAA